MNLPALVPVRHPPLDRLAHKEPRSQDDALDGEERLRAISGDIYDVRIET